MSHLQREPFKTDALADRTRMLKRRAFATAPVDGAPLRSTPLDAVASQRTRPAGEVAGGTGSARTRDKPMASIPAGRPVLPTARLGLVASPRSITLPLNFAARDMPPPPRRLANDQQFLLSETTLSSPGLVYGWPRQPFPLSPPVSPPALPSHRHRSSAPRATRRKKAADPAPALIRVSDWMKVSAGKRSFRSIRTLLRPARAIPETALSAAGLDMSAIGL